MADRQVFRADVEVKPRFRCLVCQRFVEGTAHGTCPRCGWQPPTLTPGAVARAPAPWRAWVGGVVVAAWALAVAYLLRAS